MKLLRNILIMMTVLLFSVQPACAEFDDMEDMDYWSEQLYRITEEIGIRPVGSEAEVAAMDYLRAELESFGFSAEAGTLQEYPVEIALGNDLEAILPASQSEQPNIIVIPPYMLLAPATTAAAWPPCLPWRASFPPWSPIRIPNCVLWLLRRRKQGIRARRPMWRSLRRKNASASLLCSIWI